MAWTYSANPSAGNDLETVRFLSGDTESADQQMQDAEVNYLISLAGSGNVVQASIFCCQALASKYTRQANKTVGDLKIDMATIAKSYRDQAKSLEELLTSGLGTPVPYAGGISISDAQSVEDDTDRTPNVFSVGLNDNYRNTNNNPSWISDFGNE